MADYKIKIVADKTEKEYTYNEIVEMMKTCKTQARLADMLGVDPDTVTNTKQRDKRFSDAIAEGKRAWVKPVVEALYKQAVEKGDVGAAKFILNNHEPDEWAERSKQDLTVETKGKELTQYINDVLTKPSETNRSSS